MELAWWFVLGTLFASYFALGGLDYGVGVLLPAMGGDADRRAALNAIGPRFLGNEVWIVATVGVLFGAFPVLEGRLLTGAQPVLVVALLALVAVTAAVQLRSRAGDRGRRRFDRLIVVASATLAVAWGALLGALVTGVDRFADLVSAPAAGWALALSLLFPLHGATYLAASLPPGPARDRSERIRQRLTVPAIGAAALAVVLTVARDGAGRPVPAVLAGLVLFASIGGARLLNRGATVLTGLAAALPVFVVGLAGYPAAIPGLTVADAAASGDMLRTLALVAAPAAPILVAAQVMCWWVFRIRPDRPAPVYW